MKSNIEIRKYKSTDLDSAMEVYKNLCKFYGLKFDPEESKKFFSVRSYFEQYYTLVAYDSVSKKVVGLSFSEILTEVTQENYGYLKLIYIEENYRRQGIMTALINTTLEYFKEIGINHARIYLHKENLPYLNYFSEKLGFSPIITIVEKSLKKS